MYLKNLFECGMTLEMEKYHTWKYRPQNPRNMQKRKTSDAQQKVNQKNAVDKVRRLINTNFQPGDYHVVLTYNNLQRPMEKEMAKKDLQKFLRKIRDILKRRGEELFYISVSEYGKKGGIHHHLVIKGNIEPGILSSCWEFGGLNIRALKLGGDYSRLAEYLMKQASENYKDENGLFKKRWNSSRNLKKPEVKTEVVKADSWRDYPVAPKGYVLVEDSLVAGISEATGWGYQRCRFVKIQGRVKTNGRLDYDCKGKTNKTTRKQIKKIE